MVDENEFAKLQSRVDYLESELDISYEEELFKQRIGHVFPDDADFSMKSGFYGYYAMVTGIDGDDVNHAMGELDSRGLEYAVTETASGLGMEVWSESAE